MQLQSVSRSAREWFNISLNVWWLVLSVVVGCQQSDRDDWSQVSSKLLQVYIYLVAVTRLPKAARVGKPQNTITFQVSVCITFANGPLITIKSHHQAQFKGWGNRLHLLMGVVTKTVWPSSIHCSPLFFLIQNTWCLCVPRSLPSWFLAHLFFRRSILDCSKELTGGKLFSRLHIPELVQVRNRADENSCPDG